MKCREWRPRAALGWVPRRRRWHSDSLGMTEIMMSSRTPRSGGGTFHEMIAWVPRAALAKVPSVKQRPVSSSAGNLPRDVQ